MPELVSRKIGQEVQTWTRYTPDEIRELWRQEPPAGLPIEHSRAVSENMALELSAIWFRQYCVLPGSISYDGIFLVTFFKTLAERETWNRRLDAHALAGADEYGPLFCEDQRTEYRTSVLLRGLKEIAEQYPEAAKKVWAIVEEAQR